MDTRLYHYEYRRPRVNPTYSSYNVNNSMTFFMGSPKNSSAYEDMNRSNGQMQGYQRTQNNNSMPRYEQQQPRHEPRYDPNYEPRNQPPMPSEPSSRGRAQSNLSSYGNNSLAFNEREIYNKQNSKFNIISLKPKEFPDHIKQYPKLTLEDKDAFYYKKMQTMREQEGMMNQSRGASTPKQEAVVAGKHTFAPEQNKNPSYYQQGRYFIPKMLNHADEVGNIL